MTSGWVRRLMPRLALGDMINCFFMSPPCAQADFNHDGDINPDDLGDFINLYFGPPC